MKIKRSTVIISTIVVFIALTVPVLSMAASNICSVLTGTIFAPLCGWKLSHSSAPTTVNEYAICRTVAGTQDATKDFFIPLNSEGEWNDFVNNPPASTTLNVCSVGCAKVPISILLTSVSTDPSQQSIPGSVAGPNAHGGVGSTTIAFNWLNGGAMQPLLTGVTNYDPDLYVTPFDINALITFSDGSSETVTDIAPADGKWHQLPGDWSGVTGINTCAQGYAVPLYAGGNIDGGDYANPSFMTQWETTDFGSVNNYYSNNNAYYSALIQRFTNVSNCQNFTGFPLQLYGNTGGDYDPNYGDLFNTSSYTGNISDYFFSGDHFVDGGTSNFNLSNWLSSRVTSIYSIFTPSNVSIVVQPTRLITFNYDSNPADSGYAGCKTSSTPLINCQTDLIPTHLQFGSVSGGYYSSVVVTFSNGTSQTVNNFSTSAAWSTLPGDWTTVSGNFSCSSGNCNSTSSGNYGVYLKHTSTVNTQCVDANGSIDHKIATADYTFTTSFFTSQSSSYTPASYYKNNGSDSWYQFSTVIKGFWGSWTISIPGYAIGVRSVNNTNYDIYNPDFTNKKDPANLSEYPSQVNPTPTKANTSYISFNGIYDNLFTPNYSWWQSRYGVYTAQDPCYPILDTINQQCHALATGTAYSGVSIPALVVSSGPATGDTLLGGCDVGTGGEPFIDEPDSAAQGSAEYGHDSSTNPDVTNITYSCIDPNDITSNSSGF